MSEITIFSKRRTSKEGKTFYSYLTTLQRKDGTSETMRVAFRDPENNRPPKPESCPRNIVFDKDTANISTNTYTDDNGEVRQRKTLWLTSWEEGQPYVDRSKDDYDL